MTKIKFTTEELRQRLRYEPDTGRLFWLKCRNSRLIGVETKSLDASGYIQVNIQGTVMKGHRIAWALHHGEWPSDDIDHINGIRNDNRIANLRVVNGTLNTQNKRNGSCKNNSGFLGVYKAKVPDGCKQYRAKIMKGGEQFHLGTFSTPEEAHAAYVAAKRVMHEGCTI